jgi:predicted molibdopterin-dependent oxidoreductase YjgC
MKFQLKVDGVAVEVPVGASVVAALMTADVWSTRRSVSGEARFALCGMGQCQECRVSIDGVPHHLACMVRCREGMVVETGAACGS